MLDNGEVVVWGDDWWSVLTNGSTSSLPDGCRYVGISAGSYYNALGLLNNGEVIAWGIDGSDRVVSSATSVNREVFNRGRQFVSISAGSRYALGLLDNGEVVGWGNNHYGKISGWKNALLRVGGSRYIAVSAGDHMSMGLTDNGKVVFWGHVSEVRMRKIYNGPRGRHFV